MRASDILEAADLISEKEELYKVIRYLHDDEGKMSMQIQVAAKSFGDKLVGRALHALDDMRIMKALRGMLIEDARAIERRYENIRSKGMKAADVDNAKRMLDKLGQYNELLSCFKDKGAAIDSLVVFDIKLDHQIRNGNIFKNIAATNKELIINTVLKRVGDMRDEIISDLKELGVDYEGV